MREINLLTKSYPEEVISVPNNRIAIWEEVGDVQLQCHIYDLQSMQCVKRLETIELQPRDTREYWTDSRAKGFVNPRKMLYVGPFKGFEWNLQTGRLSRQWKLKKLGDDGELTTTTYDVANNNFVQVMAGSIRVWDAKTGRLKTTIRQRLASFDLTTGEGDAASEVEFSPDARFLIYSINDYTGPPRIQIAQTANANLLWTVPDNTKTMSSHGNGLDGAEFTSDSKELYIWQQLPHEFIVYEVTTGKILRRLQGPASLSQFWLTPNNKWLYTLDKDGNIWRQRAQ